MNDDELFFLIWLMIAMGLWIVRLKWVIRRMKRANTAALAVPHPAMAPIAPPAGQPDPEIARLKERLQVLERITVDKESSLMREIEQLRDRG